MGGLGYVDTTVLYEMLGCVSSRDYTTLSRVSWPQDTRHSNVVLVDHLPVPSDVLQSHCFTCRLEGGVTPEFCKLPQRSSIVLALTL